MAELQAQVDAYHLKELVATFDGGEVPLDEAESLYDLSVTQYAQMGIDVVAYGMDGILREVVVDTLAEEAIVQYMAGELGLGLTEEQQAQFAEEAQATYDSQVDSYYQTYLAGQYESEEDGLAVAAQALDEMGYSYESYLDSLTSTQLSTNVYDYVTKDVAVTEEDIEAAYDEYVAADEATTPTPTSSRTPSPAARPSTTRPKATATSSTYSSSSTTTRRRAMTSSPRALPTSRPNRWPLRRPPTPRPRPRPRMAKPSLPAPSPRSRPTSPRSAPTSTRCMKS